jgi:phospholipase C
MDTRRSFIKKAGLLSGAAGLWTALPGSIRKALSIDPSVGTSFLDAEHVVILMQENRSFDHCFGTLRGVRGFNDPRSIWLPDRNRVWLQSNARGETYAPFHLDIKNTRATWMHSLPHSWGNQVDARNDGKYNKWLDVKRSSTREYAQMPLTMGYYDRRDIPFYFALADAFTVCDQHFCSSLTGTNPNRLYFWTGTIREQPDENAQACVWNDDMDYGTLHWTTFPERLEAAGISWKVYQNEVSIDTRFSEEEDPWLSNFQDNPLEFFSQYHIKYHPRHMEFLPARAKLLEDEISKLQTALQTLPSTDPGYQKAKSQLPKRQEQLRVNLEDQQKYTASGFTQLPQDQISLHKKGLFTNTGDPHYRDLTNLSYNDHGEERALKIPKGDILHAFRNDVISGALPTVSWLTAPEHFSDHPSSAWFGAWYVSEVMEILTRNPEIWKKTIFILTYDENDGYFDHVPPFVAPDPHNPASGRSSEEIDTRVEYYSLEQQRKRKGFPEHYERGSSIGLGFRVPLVIASPWSRGGWVNSQVFDHTSCLQFLEKFLTAKTGRKIEEPNISAWRRTVCGDLSSVFRPYQGEKIPEPDFLAKDEFIESVHKAKFKQVPSNYTLLGREDIELINRDPDASPWMPKQEIGIKPSNALPYQLYADGSLNRANGRFEIQFEAKNEIFGAESAGSPFNVYAYRKYLSLAAESAGTRELDDLRTWAYAVAAGRRVVDAWTVDQFEDGRYHLCVYGPNGFMREYKGSLQEPDLFVACDYEKHMGRLTGSLAFRISNRDPDHPVQVDIMDNSYRKGSQAQKLEKKGKKGDSATLVFLLEKQHGWYDFSIRVKGDEAFEKRYAGKVETGNPSQSDPLMGRVLG